MSKWLCSRPHYHASEVFLPTAINTANQIFSGQISPVFDQVPWSNHTPNCDRPHVLVISMHIFSGVCKSKLWHVSCFSDFKGTSFQACASPPILRRFPRWEQTSWKSSRMRQLIKPWLLTKLARLIVEMIIMHPKRTKVYYWEGRPGRSIQRPPEFRHCRVDDQSVHKLWVVTSQDWKVASDWIISNKL